MFKKAAFCVSLQITILPFLLSKSVIGDTIPVYPGTNLRSKLHNPSNSWTSYSVIGCGQCIIAFAMSGSIRKPVPPTIKPKQRTSFVSNMRISISTLILLSMSHWNMLETCPWNVSIEPLVAIDISSISATTTILPSWSTCFWVSITNCTSNHGCNVRLISRWNVADAFDNPNCITIYS